MPLAAEASGADPVYMTRAWMRAAAFVQRGTGRLRRPAPNTPTSMSVSLGGMPTETYRRLTHIDAHWGDERLRGRSRYSSTTGGRTGQRAKTGISGSRRQDNRFTSGLVLRDAAAARVQTAERFAQQLDGRCRARLPKLRR